jgi:hypothetical protein
MRFINGILSMFLTLVLGGPIFSEEATPAPAPAPAATGKSIIQGTLEAIDYDKATITVAGADGKKKVLTLSDDTKMSIDGIEAGMAAMKIGDAVWVKASGDQAEAIGVKREK